jgi:LPS-assembly lipoprotein
MQRRFASYTLILGIACLISACGFQLRGTGGQDGTTVPEDWKNMHFVTNNPNSEFSRDLQSRFAANGVLWMDQENA